MKKFTSLMMIGLLSLVVESCGYEHSADPNSPATLSYESGETRTARTNGLSEAPALDSSVQTLDTYYDFVFTGNFHTNWGGLNEKWFWSRTLGGWVYLLPSGELHDWVKNSRPPRSSRLLARGLQAHFVSPLGIIEPSTPNVTNKICGPGALSFAGGCWRYAAARSQETCTSACAANGGYDDLTRTFAGAKFDGDKSNAKNCQTLVAKFNNRPVDENYPTLDLPTPGVGCASFGRARLNSTLATTADAAPNYRQAIVYRICACNR